MQIRRNLVLELKNWMMVCQTILHVSQLCHRTFFESLTFQHLAICVEFHRPQAVSYEGRQDCLSTIKLMFATKIDINSMFTCQTALPIWSLGSNMDSGCDVHFTENRCWISKDDGKELDMIRSGGVFFVAARPSKSTSKEASTLELNPMTAAEVEHAALAREHAAFGTPVPAAGAALDGDGEPTVRIRVPTGPATPSAKERERCALSKLVSMVHCGASGGQATFEGAATRNR